MHPNGSAAVFSGDRGASVAAMAEAFARWIDRERGIGGVISAGGSGGTSLATAGMRRLPLGIPKVMVSTVASGQVGAYVGASDIMMMYSVADVQGVNLITEQVLGNAAHALAGMIAASPSPEAREARRRLARPAVGITMFGVTTPAVQGIVRRLEARFRLPGFPRDGHGRAIDGEPRQLRHARGLRRPDDDRSRRHAGRRRVSRRRRSFRRGDPHRACPGSVRSARWTWSISGRATPCRTSFARAGSSIHNPNVTLMRTTAAGEPRHRRMDGRPHQPDGRSGSASPARRRRLGARRARQAVPRSRGRRRACSRRWSRQSARPRGGASSTVKANINDDAFIAATTAAFLSVGPRRERRA